MKLFLLLWSIKVIHFNRCKRRERNQHGGTDRKQPLFHCFASASIFSYSGASVSCQLRELTSPT
ncbi:Uncharacterised protein [Vibrio cholerae]|nr:Uncharacterised protein [Vibrio cholerae]